MTAARVIRISPMAHFASGFLACALLVLVPVWGNRQECLIQIRPGVGVGHVPLIETVGDVPVNRIDQLTGLATGNLEIAAASVNQSPFGGEVTITG